MFDETDITKWTGLVPEMYFDLIARVPPGTLFVVAALLYTGSLYAGQLQDLEGGCLRFR